MAATASVQPSTRDYAAIALRYARDVVRGKIVACQWVKKACQRQLDDLERAERDPAWGYNWSEWHANDVCDFAEKFPHVEGEWGSPTIVLEPWQAFILTTVFGWRRSVDGGRRFNTAYIEVARKNAKSTITAIVALYCETCEEENGPQVPIAATTGSQARIVFDIAKAMAERTPAFRDAFGVEVLANAIVCHQNRGTIKPINAKASTQDGINPHATVIDELHAHKDRKLFDVLKSARGARKNPISWYITTAGYNVQGVCYEQRTIVTKILDGVYEGDHYFGIIYTLDEGDDPFNEAVWIKPNPNLGVSVQLRDMRTYAAEARISPDSLGEYKTKRMNLWLFAANAWLNIGKWDACAEPSLLLSAFEHEDCWIAVDLSTKQDVASVALIFLRERVAYFFARHYLPRESVEALSDRTHTHYLTWAKRGLFTLTEGGAIDYDRIEDDLRADCKRFNVRRLGFDPYQSNQIAGHLSNDGLPAEMYGENVKSMSEPAKEFEARINTRRLHHPGDPVLRWMASNVCVRRDEKGNIYPKKESKQSPNKIDGIKAGIVALAMAGRDVQAGPTDSVYETRGPLVLGG